MESTVSATIEVKSIVKHFGRVTALDDISFSVQSGEMFFLLGPSGCGKTTLLRILAGLETPDSGLVYFDGRNVCDLPPHERGAPMVFQNYALWPHLSVYENVAFGLVERKVARPDIRKRVEDVLERVDLKGMGTRMPGQLSGGQQQRVVLARALVLNPKVVLLDEPLSNLDAKLRSEMREEIEHLHATTPITFIYVTHDQMEALTLADRMAVINCGRLCALGTPDELYHRPPNIFCAEFLGDANILPVTGMQAHGPLVDLAVPFGIITSSHPVPTTTGPVLAFKAVIRPENIRPLDGDIDTRVTNTIKARIERRRMNGTTLTVYLRTDTGHEMKATLLNSRGCDCAAGTVMTWAVDFNSVIIVPESA